MHPSVDGVDYEVNAVAGDLSAATNCEDVLGQLEEFDPVEVLVNNAGIFSVEDFFAIDDDEWLRYFQEHEPTSLIQRFVTVEEGSTAAVFLAGDGAANGSALRVEGGIIRAL